jgi:hypothetical protein
MRRIVALWYTNYDYVPMLFYRNGNDTKIYNPRRQTVARHLLQAQHLGIRVSRKWTDLVGDTFRCSHANDQISTMRICKRRYICQKLPPGVVIAAICLPLVFDMEGLGRSSFYKSDEMTVCDLFQVNVGKYHFVLLFKPVEIDQ